MTTGCDKPSSSLSLLFPHFLYFLPYYLGNSSPDRLVPLALVMATPIRKKRNFKALQLQVAGDVPAPAAPKEPDPIAIRTAPTVAGAVPGLKKRPPPMTLKAPKIPTPSGAVSAVEQDGNLLTVASGPNSAPHTSTASVKRNTYHATLSTTLANLDMNAEIKFDLRNEDLKDLQELGQGNGGSVKKVEHVPTKTIMAKKVRHLYFSRVALVMELLRCRSFSSMRSPLYASKFCASCKSCTTVTPSILSPSMVPFSPIRTSASAWNSWIKALSMGYTRKLALSISMSSARSRWQF